MVYGRGWLTKGKPGNQGGFSPNLRSPWFSHSFFSSVFLPVSLLHSLPLSQGALMRIPLISWGLTGTQTTLHLIPPSPPLGQQEASHSTAALNRSLCMPQYLAGSEMDILDIDTIDQAQETEFWVRCCIWYFLFALPCAYWGKCKLLLRLSSTSTFSCCFFSIQSDNK